MEKNDPIAVFGSSGLVGSSIIRNLKQNNYANIIEVSRNVCNFLIISEVNDFFRKYTPKYVFNVVGKVGGINANNINSAEYIYENLLMQTNIINSCHVWNVTKMIFTGSSCIYPKLCPQPIKEEYLLTGPLEQTNIGYAVAKIAGITMCNMYRKQHGSNFISAMPTNLYGPCFSSDTEILTTDGIKNIKDININDFIYTLNPENHNVEITKVIHVQNKSTTDEFFTFKAKAVDFKVTPDHKMYYSTSTGFVKKTANTFREKIGSKYGQITLSDFNIIKNDNNCLNKQYDLYDYIDTKHIVYDTEFVRDYKHSHSKKYPLKYNLLDWAEFLGWYISEGSFCERSGQIKISQSKEKNELFYNEINDLLSRMNIPYGKDNHSFYFSSRLFSNYIKKNIGLGSYNKSIPKEFLIYSIPYIVKLKIFESLMKGDGHKSGGFYTTVSKQLNLDFIYLSFLLGYKANGTGRISLRRQKTTVKYKNINIEKVNNEKVYCITTEKNNIIYAGRNNKFNWIGQCDNFNYQDSHVLPALIRKFHEAKINNYKYVEFWGTGSPRREFLFVDDLAEALVFLMNEYNEEQHVNVGCGSDVTIKELAHTLKKVIGYEGDIMWNSAYPDGTPQKLLDVSKIHQLGWHHKTNLEEGLKLTYDWFCKHYNVLHDDIRK